MYATLFRQYSPDGDAGELGTAGVEYTYDYDYRYGYDGADYGGAGGTGGAGGEGATTGVRIPVQYTPARAGSAPVRGFLQVTTGFRCSTFV